MSNTVPTAAKPSPNAVIQQLRVLKAEIDEAKPLSNAERALLKARTRKQPPHIVEASINVIGKSEKVAQAVGQPLDEIRQLQVDAIDWDAVADELRSFLKAVEGASVVRRERLAFIGVQAYAIGSRLVKDPANADLLPQVEEIKRLKALARRKKTQAAPQSPSPAPEPHPHAEAETMTE
ncbi:MAG TPA: hypothetical protein VF381_16645 [Thermoanaerobaculia bacterium]